MKMSPLFSRIALFVLGISVMFTMVRCSNEVYAQNKTEDEAMVTRIVNEQHYTFKAQTVMPATGRTRQLNDNYDVSISKDSVASWLPYFGRAYQAPMDPTKGGIQFTSTDFDYSTAQRNDGWEITIKPKDTRDVQEIFLTIFKTGSATLRVASISRQPISFGGYITEKGK
jgi:hypothetical protein